MSIRGPESVARLSRTFSRSLSAIDLAELLVSLDENQPATAALELLRARGLGVLGVRRAGSVAGWVARGDLTGGALGDHVREFRPGDVIDENASLAVVLGALAGTGQVFLEWLGEVAGVITRRDLQKPPLRMWLFGAITVLETNLTWAVETLYPGDSWQEVMTPGRLEKARVLRDERERRDTDCLLIDCLQIKDKADILASDAARLAPLGLKSRREARRLTQEIQTLRNYLAHAQEFAAEHLATAAHLASLIESILRGEAVQRMVEMKFEPPNGTGDPGDREVMKSFH
jgi:hypothetical protein